MRETGRFAALGYRDFKLFWAGQVISYSGTWMHATAQGWLVYTLTNSPFYLGMVSAASWLPILLLSLFGGAVADRFRKRNLLLVTQAISIVPALVIGVLTVTGQVTVWHVMAMGMLLGTVNAFDIPARQSFLIEMVRRRDLLNAIALNSAAFNGARIIGPVIAGIIIATVGIAAVFFINALSFLAVIVALAMMKTRGEPSDGPRKSIFADIRESIGFIQGEPGILRPIGVVSVFSVFGLPFIAMMPVFARDILAVGPEGLGYLAGAAGAGAFTAAMIIAYRGQMKGKRRYMSVSSVVFPIALLVFAMSETYAISLIALFVVGLAMVSFLALTNNTIQMLAPDNMRGRIMSVYTTMFLGMVPVGHAVMGTLADRVGTANAIALGAGICLFTSVIILAGKKK